MSSNVNTVIDRADNHFIVVREKRSICNNLEDSNKQVCVHIHMSVKDMEFKERFEKHNVSPDEKIGFKEDWKDNWNPSIGDDAADKNISGLPYHF